MHASEGKKREWKSVRDHVCVREGENECVRKQTDARMRARACTSERDVAVQEASLVDEAQDVGTADLLLLPVCKHQTRQTFILRVRSSPARAPQRQKGPGKEKREPRRLTHGPVVVNVFGDVGRRVVGGEREFFGLAADQDQPQVNLEGAQTQRLIRNKSQEVRKRTSAGWRRPMNWIELGAPQGANEAMGQTSPFTAVDA